MRNKVTLKSTTPKAIAEIFDSPSDEEDFPGFEVAPPGDSSEDSTDSLYSRASAKTALRFKSEIITAELAHLFSHSDSEGEEFEGFSNEEEEENNKKGRFSKRLKAMIEKTEEEEEEEEEEDSDVDTGFYSDGEEEAPPKRRSLCVALRFPTKRLSTPKPEVPEKKIRKTIPAALPAKRTNQKTKWEKEEEEDDDVNGENQKEEEELVLPQDLSKRDKNIKENKAMLAKLFAELSSMADLTPLSTPQKKRRTSVMTKRKLEPDVGSERRNPSRKARPPEHFGVEEKGESPGGNARLPRAVDIRRLMEVDGELGEGVRRKRRSTASGGGSSSRRSSYVVRSVDDITEEDLDNIAVRAKDKIWDKENGSSCHQCRQKTLDTKTVCRSGVCRGGKGQFCGPCLKNRYGEDVRTVLLDPTWSCPICRGVCNCSLCRKREGRCATGILVGLARYNGHNNVHQYLESLQKELGKR